MKLEEWIDGSHLNAAAIARRRAAFEADRFRSAVLDGFLVPEKHKALQEL